MIPYPVERGIATRRKSVDEAAVVGEPTYLSMHRCRTDGH